MGRGGEEQADHGDKVLDPGTLAQRMRDNSSYAEVWKRLALGPRLPFRTPVLSPVLSRNPRSRSMGLAKTASTGP